MGKELMNLSPSVLFYVTRTDVGFALTEGAQSACPSMAAALQARWSWDCAPTDVPGIARNNSGAEDGSLTKVPSVCRAGQDEGIGSCREQLLVPGGFVFPHTFIPSLFLLLAPVVSPSPFPFLFLAFVFHFSSAHTTFFLLFCNLSML